MLSTIHIECMHTTRLISGNRKKNIFFFDKLCKNRKKLDETTTMLAYIHVIASNDITSLFEIRNLSKILSYRIYRIPLTLYNGIMKCMR